MKTGIELIAEERARQIQMEGWTPEHDDAHTDAGIIAAAMAYCETTRRRLLDPTRDDSSFVRKMYWPWDKKWWKPKDNVRNLVRAGALIAAEIDRLQRIQP